MTKEDINCFSGTLKLLAGIALLIIGASVIFFLVLLPLEHGQNFHPANIAVSIAFFMAGGATIRKALVQLGE